jgi:hypothetical protein
VFFLSVLLDQIFKVVPTASNRLLSKLARVRLYDLPEGRV